MAYEMRAGSGSAFKNDKKTEDWHPAYRGKVMLPDGSVHWMDVSPKKTAAGEPWVSVKIGNPVQPMNGGGGGGGHSPAPFPLQPQPKAVVRAVVPDLDDDIPF